MDRENGVRPLGVGAVGAFAALALLAGPPASRDRAVEPAAQLQPRVAGNAAPAGVERRPYDRGARLLADFFGAAPAPPAGHQGSAPPALAAETDFDVLIATLPDPFDSHLDYAYDAHLEAIQVAFADAGFVLDRFWLPQRGDSLRVVETTGRTQVDGAARARTADTVRVPLHERHPGVILFRRNDAGRLALRLVYVVPEMPTSGVHKPALEAALREREALRALLGGGATAPSAAADTIRVIGPSFSGSALSIDLVLSGWLAPRRAAGAVVLLVSGSATSLDTTLVRDAAAKGTVFRTTVRNDAHLEAVLRCTILPALDLAASQVLLLVESSTEYGQALAAAGVCPTGSAADDTGAFHVIRFPMAIGSLRAEYARNPATADPDRPLPGAPIPPRIPIPLGDAAHPRERPPVLSPLTPPALDLELASIARVLRDNRIRVVGLQASDVRDKLFLAEEIRRRVRDVQFFTYESDLLYSRPDYAAALRGMLVLSTYPLVPANQGWAGGRRGWHMAAGGSAVGHYNATLVLLGEVRELREYATPLRARSDTAAAPPVWLTAVGNGSLAPVTVFDPEGVGADPLLVRRAPPDPGQTPGGALGAAYGAAHASALPTRLLPLVLALAASAAAVVLALSPLVRRVRHTLVRQTGAPPPPAEDTPHTRAFAWLPSTPRPRGATVVGSAWRSAVAFEPVQEGSLRVHRHLYHGLLLLSVLAVVTPVSVLLLRGSAVTGVARPLAVMMVVGWLGAFGALVAALGELWRIRCTGWDYIRRGWRAGPLGDHLLWMGEILLRCLVGLLGLGYAALVLWLGHAMNQLHRGKPSTFALLYYRTLDLGSGVSPFIPVALGALGFAAWCAWHRQRIALLLRKSPFEAACLRRAALDGELPEEGETSAVERTLSRLAHDVVALRRRLFMVVPEAAGAGLLVLLLVLAIWLWRSFGRTSESIVLPSSGWWPNAFEMLLRFSVVGLLVAVTWGVYRLTVVWLRLREFLDHLSELPLVTAFERLPPRVSRLTRLTLFSPRSQHVVEAVSATQWGHMQEVFRNRRDQFVQAFAASPGIVHTMDDLMAPRLAEGGAVGGAWQLGVRRIELLGEILEAMWRAEPQDADIDTVAAELSRLDMEHMRGEIATTVSTSSRFRRIFTDSVRLWLRAAEEYAAVQVVEYVEWVLRHLRRLAGFLLLALLLTTGTLSSYPFNPQSRAKLTLFCVLAVAVGSLVVVLAQMNRNEVLSRIVKTDPGRITWNVGFVINLVLFAVIPLLAVVSTEFPEVRGVLFGWVEPLLRTLARA